MIEKLQQTAREFLAVGGWDVPADKRTPEWKAARSNWTRAISEAPNSEIEKMQAAAAKALVQQAAPPTDAVN